MKMIHSYQGEINYEVLKPIMASNMQEDVTPRSWKSKKGLIEHMDVIRI